MVPLWLCQSHVLKNILGTLVFVAILFGVRFIIARYIRVANKEWSSQQRLRGLGYLRTITFALLLVGLVYIWAAALQGFALSLFAIALAFVVSIKETFINLNGALFRWQGHLYEIGDRIVIKGIRGDVIDVSVMGTTIMEIGVGSANHQSTGRRVTIPNSLLLEEPVYNESFLDTYYLNNLVIPIKRNENWQAARDSLLQIAKEECAPYIEQARLRIRSLERSRSLELPSVEPRISIHLPNPELIHLHLRVPCPVHLKERVEQAILSRYLTCD
ncbi:MAG: mechanosensitive ion channel family protein [Simkaniaceae bacterium]|nr:mechanosensitive ion channel family protein [Simkaniaceae bacterium]